MPALLNRNSLVLANQYHTAEDIEQAFEGLQVKELCVFAANYIWASRSMVGEQLVLVIHLEHGQTFT